MNSKPSVLKVVKNIGSVGLLFTLTKMDRTQAVKLEVESYAAA